MDNTNQAAPPAGHAVLLDSDTDAEFLGWQKLGGGVAVALYVITAAGHPLLGSTVSGKTLDALNLKIPETPALKGR